MSLKFRLLAPTRGSGLVGRLPFQLTSNPVAYPEWETSGVSNDELHYCFANRVLAMIAFRAMLAAQATKACDWSFNDLREPYKERWEAVFGQVGGCRDDEDNRIPCTLSRQLALTPYVEKPSVGSNSPRHSRRPNSYDTDDGDYSESPTRTSTRRARARAQSSASSSHPRSRSRRRSPR